MKEPTWFPTTSKCIKAPEIKSTKFLLEIQQNNQLDFEHLQNTL